MGSESRTPYDFFTSLAATRSPLPLGEGMDSLSLSRWHALCVQSVQAWGGMKHCPRSNVLRVVTASSIAGSWRVHCPVSCHTHASGSAMMILRRGIQQTLRVDFNFVFEGEYRKNFGELVKRARHLRARSQSGVSPQGVTPGTP